MVEQAFVLAQVPEKDCLGDFLVQPTGTYCLTAFVFKKEIFHLVKKCQHITGVCVFLKYFILLAVITTLKQAERQMLDTFINLLYGSSTPLYLGSSAGKASVHSRGGAI